MAGGFILLHIIPFDGKFFDDPEQAIFSLLILNLAVFILIIMALISVREGRKKAALEAKAQRKAAKQNLADQVSKLDGGSAAPEPKTASKPGSSGKKTQGSRSMAATSPAKNYTRPTKK
ncbi:MAG: hypothetical protein JWP00_4244 [Chloroflexi bacterium]|jgi:hypothetical protein|nr:hypothetical protein [Chloroflexota bacterium]